MNNQTDGTRASLYPLRAGFRVREYKGASQQAAREVDFNQDRRLKVDCLIAYFACFYGSLVSDEIIAKIARRTDDPARSVQPRISELVAMKLLVKGPTVKRSLHKRAAHLILPTDELRKTLSGLDPNDPRLERLLPEIVESCRAVHVANQKAEAQALHGGANV